MRATSCCALLCLCTAGVCTASCTAAVSDLLLRCTACSLNIPPSCVLTAGCGACCLSLDGKHLTPTPGPTPTPTPPCNPTSPQGSLRLRGYPTRESCYFLSSNCYTNNGSSRIGLSWKSAAASLWTNIYTQHEYYKSYSQVPSESTLSC